MTRRVKISVLLGTICLRGELTGSRLFGATAPYGADSPLRTCGPQSGSPVDRPRTDGRSALDGAAVYEIRDAARAAHRRGGVRLRSRQPTDRARSARAPREIPISASSAAAWTAVATIGTPARGASGWARAPSWSAGARRLRGLREARRRTPASAACARKLGRRDSCEAAVWSRRGRRLWSRARDLRRAKTGRLDGPARLSLRRCGRVRGSAPRRSVGCSSLMPMQKPEIGPT